MALALDCHATGHGQVVHYLQNIAGHGDFVEPENDYRCGRFGEANPFARVIEHGAYRAGTIADQDVVIEADGAVLDEHRGNWSSLPIHFCFDHRPDCFGVGVGFVVLDICDKQNHFQQAVDIGAHAGRYFDTRDITAVRFNNHVIHGELLLDQIGIGIDGVDFVNRHNQWHASGAHVRNGFDGLGHHAVVSSDHKHHDVSDLGTTGTHGREGFVTGSVEEGDFAVRNLDRISTQVLGNSTGFAFGDAGLPDCIKQFGFTVVDVTHDGDHRWSRNQGRFGLGCDAIFDVINDTNHLFGDILHCLDIVFRTNQGCGVVVNLLIDIGQHATLKHDFQNIGSTDAGCFGQFTDGQRAADLNRTLWSNDRTRSVVGASIGHAGHHG